MTPEQYYEAQETETAIRDAHKCTEIADRAGGHIDLRGKCRDMVIRAAIQIIEGFEPGPRGSNCALVSDDYLDELQQALGDLKTVEKEGW